jgi:photosystem II stability/assembly factor-like uncharacterized protein
MNKLYFNEGNRMQADSYQQSFFGRKIGRMLSIVMVISYICWLPSILYAQQKKQHELYDDLFSITFPSEKEGWACGRWGTMLHTSDGGKTWIHQKSGTDFTLSSVYFVDSKNGWAVGNEGIIINTRDGGNTWKQQKSPVSFFLMKVYFVTPLKGWIVTEQTHILSTGDGGKTWSIQFKDQDFVLKSISFCDQLHGWAVGEYGHIYHTKDGGVTWKKQAGYFELLKSTGEMAGDNFLFDVVAVDPQTAWAVGIDGYVIRTIDGGKTWKEVKTEAPKTPLFCIASDKAGKILIGGNQVFLSSNDNGRTWEIPKFEPPITYGWLYGLARCGNSSFVVVGWEGAIYRKFSNTWKRVVN